MRFSAYLTCFIVLLATYATAINAAQLPTVDELRQRMGRAPITVPVYEPHLSVGDNHVTIEYVGYPAIDVMLALFGETWRGTGETVELRAQDGYVSRIDVARFDASNAYIVFARKDGAAFKVDNIAQNEANVPLGPYYLVWDNISNPQLLADGARNWPYQVNEIKLVNLADKALLPAGLAPRFHEGAALAKIHCLSCHQINGFGGEKFEGNLAEIAKRFDETDFLTWVLAPSTIKQQTTMPPLAQRAPQAERQRIARALFDYLRAMPVAP